MTWKRRVRGPRSWAKGSGGRHLHPKIPRRLGPETAGPQNGWAPGPLGSETTGPQDSWTLRQLGPRTAGL